VSATKTSFSMAVGSKTKKRTNAHHNHALFTQCGHAVVRSDDQIDVVGNAANLQLLRCKNQISNINQHSSAHSNDKERAKLCHTHTHRAHTEHTHTKHTLSHTKHTLTHSHKHKHARALTHTLNTHSTHTHTHTLNTHTQHTHTHTHLRHVTVSQSARPHGRLPR